MDSDYNKLEEYLKKTGLILPFDKPLGWTSFDLTNKVRVHLKYAHNIRKIKAGHAGTLDPLATGLLLICIGKATKRISELQDLPKTYTGTFRLGASTPSFDGETEITERMPTDHITHEMIRVSAQKFIGNIMQVPPDFSAIKIGGKRAYELARKEMEVVLKPRPVMIYGFNVISVESQDVHFEIKCSKGTYIRAIARDLGKMLNTCAYLTALRRTQIGSYNVNESFSLDNLEDAFIMGNEV